MRARLYPLTFIRCDDVLEDKAKSIIMLPQHNIVHILFATLVVLSQKMHSHRRFRKTPYTAYEADQEGEIRIPRSTLHYQRKRKLDEDEVRSPSVIASPQPSPPCESQAEERLLTDDDSTASQVSSNVMLSNSPSLQYASGQEDLDVSFAASDLTLQSSESAHPHVPGTSEEQAYLLMDLLRWRKTRSTKQHLQLDLKITCSFMKRIAPGGKTDYPTSIHMVRKLYEPALSLRHMIYYVCPDHLILLGGQLMAESKNVSYVCDFDHENVHTAPVASMQQSSFLYVPVRGELAEILRTAQTEVYEGLQRRNARTLRTKVTELVEGEFCYKIRTHVEPFDLLMVIHTDGAEFSKSSDLKGYALHWTLADLPARSRTTMGMLNTLWIGKSAHMPHRKVLLQPFLAEMKELGTTGIGWALRGKNVHSRVYVVCCVCDVMERGPMAGIWSPHSKRGCTLCKALSVTRTDPNKPRSHRQVYLAATSIPADPRTDGEVFTLGKELSELPLDMRDAARIDPYYLGVCELPVLASLRKFSLVDSMPVEWMHLMLKGLIPKFYFACPLLAKANSRLDARAGPLDLPNAISRKFRPFEHAKYFKSNEWCNVLFAGPYLFHGIVSPEAFCLWCLLVSVATTVVMDELTSSDLKRLDQECVELVRKMETFFGQQFMVYNVHQILHLAKTCRNFGSMAGFSALAFEDWIGKLMKSIKGSNQVTRELGKTLVLEKITDHLVDRVQSSVIADDLTTILEGLSRSVFRARALKVDGFVLLGSAASQATIERSEPDILEALENYTGRESISFEAQFFQKIVLKGYQLDNRLSQADKHANGLFYADKQVYRLQSAALFEAPDNNHDRVFLVCQTSVLENKKVYDQEWHLPTFSVFQWTSALAVIPARCFDGIALEMPYREGKSLACRLPRTLYLTD